MGSVFIPSQGGGVTNIGPIPFRGLAGLEPEKLSGNVLRIQPGSTVNASGTDLLSSTAPIDIDLTTNGALGADTGAPANGQDWFVFILKNNTNGTMSAIASQSITYGGVVVPSGYSVFRKLPWGFVYRTTAGWGAQVGIPDFHLTSWPKPLTTYTAFELASPFLNLSNGLATAFTDINLSSWVPDNARLVRLFCQTEYNSAAGTAYLRTYGTQDVGIAVGAVHEASAVETTAIDLRVSSTRRIQYRVTGGARLDVGITGYYQTEPS